MLLLKSLVKLDPLPTLQIINSPHFSIKNECFSYKNQEKVIESLKQTHKTMLF